MTSPHHLCTPQMETGRFFFNRQQDAKYLATPSRCRPRTFGSTVWNHGSSQTNRKVRVELISCWPAAFCLSDNQFIVKILLVFFFYFRIKAHSDRISLQAFNPPPALSPSRALFLLLLISAPTRLSVNPLYVCDVSCSAWGLIWMWTPFLRTKYEFRNLRKKQKTLHGSRTQTRSWTSSCRCLSIRLIFHHLLCLKY